MSIESLIVLLESKPVYVLFLREIPVEGHVPGGPLNGREKSGDTYGKPHNHKECIEEILLKTS